MYLAYCVMMMYDMNLDMRQITVTARKYNCQYNNCVECKYMIHVALTEHFGSYL